MKVKTGLVFFAAFLMLFVYGAQKWHAEKNFCIKLPAHFNEFDHAPFVDVVIEDKLYLGIVAFSKFPLAAKRVLLREVQHKEEAGFQSGHNGDGQMKRSKAFLLPEVSIGSIKWENVLAVEGEEENAPDDLDPGICQDHIFAIGRAFFERVNLLIDFEECQMYATHSLETLQKKGLFPKDALKVPIEKNPLGEVVILVETTFGPLRFAIHPSWGFSTCIKPDLVDKKNSTIFEDEEVFETKSLKIAGHDFGPLLLFPYFDAPAVKEYDGYFGMEFLKNKKIYIDYPNGFIYIAK